jgi:hypothetical protein
VARETIALVSDPEGKQRGILKQGARGGAIGFVGCLTFIILGIMLLYACAAAVGD